MDSTHSPHQHKQPPIDDPHALPTISKLPIKRKTPDTSVYGGGGYDNPRPPPFKFHRIWTEPDEIRFLQGLLDSTVERLSFPRDLNVFYMRFSDSMSQPYTKSQLSEKLRRLRKKFRVISTRLSKGLDPSLLSPHDRSLYHLSRQLWHPDYALNSPFSTVNCVDYHNNNAGIDRVDRVDNQRSGCSDSSGSNSSFVGVMVRFSPNVPGFDPECLISSREGNEHKNEAEEENNDVLDVKLSEVNVELEEEGITVKGEAMVGQQNHAHMDRVKEEEMATNYGPVCIGEGLGVNGIGELAANVVINVFIEALEDVRMGILVGEGSKANGSLELVNEEKGLRKQ